MTDSEFADEIKRIFPNTRDEIVQRSIKEMKDTNQQISEMMGVNEDALWELRKESFLAAGGHKDKAPFSDRLGDIASTLIHSLLLAEQEEGMIRLTRKQGLDALNNLLEALVNTQRSSGGYKGEVRGLIREARRSGNTSPIQWPDGG